jgi:hypothetical protein
LNPRDQLYVILAFAAVLAVLAYGLVVFLAAVYG